MLTQYWRVFALVIALMSVSAYQLYGVFSNVGYAPTQPIPFSHVIHAGVLQMECLYCHHQAEKGPYAGIPEVASCMGCHSIVKTDSPYIKKLADYYERGEPIPWVKIHRLPDHSYFSHKWHVAAGISCQECHGPVQNMPVVAQWSKLEMGACMTCHRQDTYVSQINHPPTYHELPFEQTELEAAAEVVSADGAGFDSAVKYAERHRGADLGPEEARALLARLEEYRKDKYLHGRVAQLRNANASVECSTCHH